MSEQTGQVTDSEIREKIAQRIRTSKTVTLAEVEDDVSRDLGIADVEVRAEIIALEDAGLIDSVDELDRDEVLTLP